MNFDYLIVGAGFSGLVAAERLSNLSGAKCLIVEKRCHIGGNAQDEYDDHGVLLHKYGPHYFRTNSDRVVEYLSQFTEWRHVDYSIKSFTHGRYWTFPINLNTFEEYLGRPSTSEEMSDWLDKNKLSIETPSNSEQVITSQVGWDFYKLFFEGYTQKQWRRPAKELDPSVCGRIPIRMNRDNRYLNEKFQALPASGYHKLFEKMLLSCRDKVQILLNADYRQILPFVKYRHLIYTGPIDEYFDFLHGPLPYRSLRFERESYTGAELASRQSVSGQKGFWQPTMQVNYPNEEQFTRIVEIKHATGQQCLNTTIVKEFPEDFRTGLDPYYPIPNAESKSVYKKYKEMAEMQTKVSFIGRLATYRYYNMDQVIGMALSEVDDILTYARLNRG